MNESLYEYDGALFPTYLKDGNALRFILPVAAHFCKGNGLDIGCGKWPFPGATPIDITLGHDAMALPAGEYDYIVSSHALEHLADPVGALEHWKTRLRSGGCLFLYLPDAAAMPYWRPTRNRKHLHMWSPFEMADMFGELGFIDVIRSERDLAWSFSVVGWKP